MLSHEPQLNTAASTNAPGRGFTLIELLVVISVVALLIAILLPTLSKAREVAQTAVCLANHRQTGLAHALYQADSKESLVATKIYRGPAGTFTVNEHLGFASTLLGPYVGIRGYDAYASADRHLSRRDYNRRLQCPLIQGGPFEQRLLEFGWNDATVANTPAVNLNHPGLALNPYWLNWQPGASSTDHKAAFEDKGWPRINRIEQPSSYVMFREWGDYGTGLRIHADRSVTYAYADGHVQLGEDWWYIWGN